MKSAKSVALAVALCSAMGIALAHDSIPKQTPVNPASQRADRDNAKLNFLEVRGRLTGVAQSDIEAARGVYYTEYLWPKSNLSICFWNGSEAQQLGVMELADVWHQAVPSMQFIFLDDARRVRKCQLDQLRNLRAMSDIRINLDPNDSRPLWAPVDMNLRNGDWSHPGRSVSQIADYPTTMSLAGAMKLKAQGLISDYHFNVRHEFGHALGLVHEHQRALCEGWFNIQAIASSQNWSLEMAKAQVSSLGNTSNQYGFVGSYDINSIMQYNFAPAWYVPDKPTVKNPCRRRDQVDDLSEMDKVTIAFLYEPTLNDTPTRAALISSQRAAGQAAVSASVQPAQDINDRKSVELALLKFAKNIGAPESINIQVFPHPVDKDVVLKAVLNLGYPLKDRAGNTIRSVSSNPTKYLQGDPTNSILYTSDVSDQDVRFVALNLLNAGVEIKSIQPYWPAVQNNFTKRDHLIQIGASQWNRTRSALSVDDILTKPIPMYGAAR